MRLPCSLCRKAIVNPNAVGTHREIRGWEEVRQQGGAHGIVLREETGRVACKSCVLKMKGNIDIDQGSLL